MRYHLSRPWPTPTGRTELEFEPQALLRRLSALMPGPYLNMIRYNGVFANRSRFREKLPPPRPPTRATSEQQPEAPAAAGNADLRPRRLGWAQLLRRVLDIDVLTCAKCASAMTVIAFLTDTKVVTRILDHLALPSAAPLIAEPRLPAAEDQYCDVPLYDETVPSWDDSQESPPDADARDPP